MDRIAIIGGTGFEQFPATFKVTREIVSTPFGPASVSRAITPEGGQILFLSRHGEDHSLAPHEINYRANISALAELGVQRVLATNAVGSLRLDLAQGSLMLFDDFIDFTRARPVTLFQAAGGLPVERIHTDFSEPYCQEMRAATLDSATELDIPLLPRGTYLCADGPRFESPAEVKMFSQWGGDVVGMTGMPEAIFAREAGICYAAIGIVTNLAAGIRRHGVEGDSLVSHTEVVDAMASAGPVIRRLILRAIELIPAARRCRCSRD